MLRCSVPAGPSQLPAITALPATKGHVAVDSSEVAEALPGEDRAGPPPAPARCLGSTVHVQGVCGLQGFEMKMFSQMKSKVMTFM